MNKVSSKESAISKPDSDLDEVIAAHCPENDSQNDIRVLTCEEVRVVAGGPMGAPVL